MSTPVSFNDSVTTNDMPFEAPYNRLMPEFTALEPEELQPINIDITSAVTTTLGAFPEIIRYLTQIADEMPKYDLEPIRKLEGYAMAASHAQTVYSLAHQPNSVLQAHVEEGTAIREQLLLDATALGNRGIVDASRLKDLKGPVGYKNLAVDLQLLAKLFRESFEQQAATGWPIKRQELQNAERLAAEILRAVGLREQGPMSIDATADMRVRAFTLFVRAYDHARRAISHLRWNQDDVDTIIPSLYAGRGGRKKSSTDVEVRPPAAPATLPSNPATASPSIPGVQPAANNKPGSPVGGPFMT